MGHYSTVAILNAADAAWRAEDGRNSDGHHYTELVDLDSMVAYWLVSEIMGNEDASRGGYLHVDRGGKIKFGPVWDFDWGAGSITVDQDATGWKCSFKPWKQCIFKDWLKHSDFRGAARAAYLAHCNEIKALVYDGCMLDAWRKYLSESGVADTARWMELQDETFAQYGGARGFAVDIDTLKSYMIARLAWLDCQFASDASLAASVGITDAKIGETLMYAGGVKKGLPDTGFRGLGTTSSLSLVAEANASAPWGTYAYDEATYEQTVTGGGALSIPWQVVLDASCIGAGGTVGCHVDGIEVLNCEAYSQMDGTVECQLSYMGTHSIIWKVSAWACDGSIAGPGAQNSCSCSLYVLESPRPSVSPLSWSTIGVLDTQDGIMRLTVTNNVNSTVTFSDDLGEIILDLNGHSITGSFSAFASGDFRKASQSIIVPEVRYLFARFVNSTTADDPITDLAVTSKSFRWCVGVSVPDGDGVTYVSASLPTVSASGLPTGVKFDAVRGCFTGVPTKAGEYSAVVTVKNASKSTATLRATFKVEALPEWAQGTFDGAMFSSTGGSPVQVEWTAWQNLWKLEQWKADAKEYAKAPKLKVGEIELKFGASGAVTAKYGTYSCSTVLIPAEDGMFYVFCYFPPKVNKFDGYAAEILLKWENGHFSTNE